MIVSLTDATHARMFMLLTIIWVRNFINTGISNNTDAS